MKSLPNKNVSLTEQGRRSMDRNRNPAVGLKRRRVIRAVAVLAVGLVVSALVAYSFVNQPPAVQTASFKAAIIDQLSGTFPNTSFNDRIQTLLVNAGLSVDYYGPSQVTIELFRGLPSMGYGLVVIRAHSTGQLPGDKIMIFTSEEYRQDRFVYEQASDMLSGATSLSLGRVYFAISPRFVREAMHGSFPGSIIIMMGCTGLVNSEMARAFVDKGGRVYVSWDSPVTAERTDTATQALIQSLTDGKGVGEAVRSAMDRVGPDPVYNSHLHHYPGDQEDLTLGRPDPQGIMLNVQTGLGWSAVYRSRLRAH